MTNERGILIKLITIEVRADANLSSTELDAVTETVSNAIDEIDFESLIINRCEGAPRITVAVE